MPRIGGSQRYLITGIYYLVTLVLQLGILIEAIGHHPLLAT